MAPIFAPRIGDEVHGDKNVHVGDNNLTLNVQPAEERPAAAPPEPKPPFDPKLRVVPRSPAKVKNTERPAEQPAPQVEARETSEPINVIALAERPRPPQTFSESFTEPLSPGVSLEGTATAGATLTLSPVTATATAGTVTASALSVLEPECGIASFGSSHEDVVLETPRPHGDLICHVRVQRTGYPDIVLEKAVPAEE